VYPGQPESQHLKWASIMVLPTTSLVIVWNKTKLVPDGSQTAVTGAQEYAFLSWQKPCTMVL